MVTSLILQIAVSTIVFTLDTCQAVFMKTILKGRLGDISVRVLLSSKQGGPAAAGKLAL